MKYIDADLLLKDIDELEKAAVDGVGEYVDGVRHMLCHITYLIDHYSRQEQPEVDLEKEIEKELRSHYNDDQDVYWWNYLKNSFRHFYELGRQKQFAIDADLGSPKYERGFCDGRDFEKDKIQNLIPTLRLCKEWFDEIVEKASRLTTGNVAHLGATIRGFARNYSEYVEEELSKNSK